MNLSTSECLVYFSSFLVINSSHSSMLVFIQSYSYTQTWLPNFKDRTFDPISFHFYFYDYMLHKLDTRWHFGVVWKHLFTFYNQGQQLLGCFQSFTVSQFTYLYLQSWVHKRLLTGWCMLDVVCTVYYRKFPNWVTVFIKHISDFSLRFVYRDTFKIDL